MLVEIITMVVLWSMNALLDGGYDVLFSGDKPLYRIAFLYSHPNRAVARILWAMLSYVWLQWEKIKTKQWIVLFILGGCTYATTRSESVFLLILVAVLHSFRNNMYFNRLSNIIVKYMFFLCGLLSVVFCYNFGRGNLIGAIDVYLDRILSYRIFMGNLALSKNPITLLGNIMDFSTEWSLEFMYDQYTVDNLYILLLCNIGVVYFIILSFAFYKTARLGNYKINTFILLFSTYCLIETSAIYLTVSFSILLLQYAYFNKEDGFVRVEGCKKVIA
jgi:hypothetical protein